MVFVILISVVWFLSLWSFLPTIIKPTIKIISPKDEITISLGDTVNFETKVIGHFSYGNDVSFVNEGNLNERYYGTRNSDKTIHSIRFDRIGIYKIVAVGRNSEILGGSKVVAKSNSVTITVVNRQ